MTVGKVELGRRDGRAERRVPQGEGSDRSLDGSEVGDFVGGGGILEMEGYGVW